MSVKLKLVNHGVKNHPLFWIVAIPTRKKLNGRYLEKLGFWRPRTCKTYDRSIVLNIDKIKYWLGNGAIPTVKVHKLLEKYDLVPKMPPPFGSKYTYEKPKKEYNEATLKKMTHMHGKDIDEMVKQKIREELSLMEKRITIEGSMIDHQDIETINTTDIDSDDPNIIERNIKFDEIKKRFEKHKEYSLDILRGNDYQFNMYLRKMQKLANSRYGGLDIDGYKSYLNNLMEFKKIKAGYLFEKDRYMDDTLEVDYSKATEGHKDGQIGKTKVHHHNLEKVLSIREKRARLQAMRETLVTILKEEINARREHENSNGRNDQAVEVMNSYKRRRQADGYSQSFLDEEQLIDDVTNDKESGFTNYERRNLDFVKGQSSEDPFLEGYDSTEEEITRNIIEYLYEHPYMFKKIRVLQKNNKILNIDEIPDIKRLHEIKAKIMNDKESNQMSSLNWVKNTDQEFQEKFGSRADDIINKRNNLDDIDSRNMRDVNVEEIETAMEILVEGYRRVKQGDKEVKLSSILEAVHIKPSKQKTKQAEMDIEQEGDEDYIKVSSLLQVDSG